MPTDDLLNASEFLDAPAEDAIDLSLFSGETNGLETTRANDPAGFLPDTWRIAGVDTGLPMSKTTASALVGLGDGLSDTIDGIQQIFGSEEVKRGLQDDQNAVNQLYNDPRFGGTARVGQVGGFLADPLGVVIPVGKGKNLWDIAKVGAATGTAFGGLGYVDEGQSRGGNALMGAVTGGVLSPTLFASARQMKGLGGKIQERASSQLLNTYKKEYYKFLSNGANPAQATSHAMKKMQWTTHDKAALIMSSRKPFSVENTARVDSITGAPILSKEGKQLFDENAAKNNYQALQSKMLTNMKGYLEKTSVGKGVSDTLTDVGRAFGTAVVPMATRVAKVDQQLARDLISFEAHVHKGQQSLHEKLLGFNKSLRKMGLETSEEVRFHAQNGRTGEARRIFIEGGGTKGDWDVMQGVIRKLYNEANEAGYKLPKVKGFFPRRVKDLEGLSAHQDLNMSEAIKAFKARMRREPSDKELNDMINNIENPFHSGRFGTGGSLKRRTRETLEKEEQQFYHETEATMTSYVNDMVSDIERARFFKKIGVKKDKFASDGSDVTDTLNDVIRQGRGQGKYGEGDVKELTDLLRSRFTSGELAPRDAVQAFKNVTYIATLGNFKSALTQLGDLAFAAHKNGIINVSLELMNRIPLMNKVIRNSHQRVTKEQIGLEEAIQEFAGERNGKAALDWVLSKTGFKAMDRLGKETFINSHIRKTRNQLNGKQGAKERMRLRQKWQGVFEDETEQLIDDLAKGRFSDNVGVYLFNQLEEVQPIALSSMPKPYLDNPNGRILYMLKSFTIKQLDLMRRDILDNLAKGDTPLAFKNLTSLGTLFVLGNGSADMLKDFMTGDEIEMEDTLVDNVWKLIGLNRYTGDRALEGGFGQAIVDTVAPPLTVYDRATRAMGDSQKTWEASPFNGLQIFDKMFNNGELTRAESDSYYKTLGTAHDSFDGASFDE